MNYKTINTADELIEIINSYPNNYIFRGQSDASWQLTSSLERLLIPVWGEEGFDLKKFEDFTLKQFKERYHLYTKDSSRNLSKIETLSLMQHYGTPTRLLDFTTSPYLALYFALETYNPLLEQSFSLYAFDYKEIMDRTKEALCNFDNQIASKLKPLELESNKDKVFEEIIDRFNLDLLWITEPETLNQRIEQQAGTFLTSIDRSKKTEEALANPLYDEVDMVKYEIPSSLYEGVYSLLRKMNISGKNVYQDLDGLGKAVRMELQLYARPYR